ncbi:ADP-ribosylglycohydrolase family protein [Polaromonas sp.]|uniref:ADP-ribosylglycohydrolase family protein n=1 Tax=Polaromonas sp. TaxID=1869339 RepID=UPI0013B956DB|nr:ADP-ribosylglycohydrolase family protein [Polaromonas sp.]NDP63336.1 ADP-ribosyl-(dinitrogen reductase) hydrolase [Polaromonas sp.]
MPHSTVLTSLNRPLRVAHVCAGTALGAIGVTLCPGKWQRTSISGTWQRDLATDIDALHHWGAAAVVTLMPQDELQAVQADGMGAACEARGIEWHHLPIQDVDVPDAAFETAWLYTGLRLREHLRAGRNVLLHCRGGLGRSGTIAARLLVELGWEAQAAIRAVRSQRPGAIETRAQEAHVLQTQPVPSDESHAARVLGCILGGAVGDAFGYAIEFDSWDAICRQHGPRGLREPVMQRGQLVVSDDTQMTLFTLEAMAVTLPGQLPPLFNETLMRPFQAACRRAYLRWGITQGIHPLLKDADQVTLHLSPAMRHLRAPGNTCLSAVRAGATGTVMSSINQSKGCGAVMRTAPIGLIEGTTPELAMALGDAAGALTHGHIDGWLPGGALSAMVRFIARGEAIRPAAHHALRLLAGHPHPDQRAINASGTARLITTALQLLDDTPDRSEIFRRLGEGWTGDEALAIGVYAACAASSFEDAVRLAANHDGDSDSTASIAGQLYGARHGIMSLPHAWVRRLDVLQDALQVTQRFLEAQATAPQILDQSTQQSREHK